MMTSRVALDLRESGTLCHALLAHIRSSGGLENQPAWVYVLYNKLAKANDRLMYAKPVSKEQVNG